MALDQVLEQLNYKIKAVLGGLNLLLNRYDEGKCLLSWALSCPQILRLLVEYEKKPNAGTTEHHSNYKQLQLRIRLQGGLPEVQVIMDVLSLSLSGQYSGRDPMLCPQ